jgi:hypothetical protein
MYSTEGWKLRKEQLQEVLANWKENAHLDCQTNDVWQRRIGEINMLKFILGLEDADREQYEYFDQLVFPDEEITNDGNTLED